MSVRYEIVSELSRLFIAGKGPVRNAEICELSAGLSATPALRQAGLASGAPS